MRIQNKKQSLFQPNIMLNDGFRRSRYDASKAATIPKKDILNIDTSESIRSQFGIHTSPYGDQNNFCDSIDLKLTLR